MTRIPEELRYTKDHEWVKIVDGMAVMGISDFAQHAMGDVVYVELPDVAKKVKAGDDFIVVESVKGANDVFSPVSGTVAELNDELDGAPELLNQDPYANWLVKIEPDDAAELDNLLDAAAYGELVAKLEAESE